MKIILTESQMALLRRMQELEEILNDFITELNNDIKSGGPGNKPNNFGVYESWLINRIKEEFEHNNPNIEFTRHDFIMLVSGQFNDKIRMGYNKVKKKR